MNKKNIIITTIIAVIFCAVGIIIGQIIKKNNQLPVQNTDREISELKEPLPTSDISFNLESISPTILPENQSLDNAVRVNKVLLTMDEQRKINIFFSNFSESQFYTYYKDDPNYEELLNFAFIHNLINNHQSVFYKKINNPYFDDTCMGISSDTFDATIKKYFDIQLPHKSTVHRNDYGSYRGWVYQDNKFFTSAASGESYDFFSIVTDLIDQRNGTYAAEINTYQLPYDGLNPYNNIPDYYSYSENDAEKDKDCTLILRQTATIAPYEYEGKNTWKLISLSISS